jgi:hypothetical protein
MSSGYTRNFDDKYDPTTGKFAQDRTERAIPRFWIEEVFNKATNNLDQIEMVEIRVPGESKNVWGGKVTQEHRRRFAKHYQAFKNNEEMPVTGTPLNKLPGMTHQLLAELKYIGFSSVEDLARATDQAIGEFHAGLTWRKKAQLYIEENAKTSEAVSQKDAIIAEQGAALKALQEQMAEMSRMMLAQSESKKPGRPKKAEQVAA